MTVGRVIELWHVCSLHGGQCLTVVLKILAAIIKHAKTLLILECLTPWEDLGAPFFLSTLEMSWLPNTSLSLLSMERDK